MPPGYHGCYLRIDASNGHAERVPLADDLLRQYLGGSGLGARLLLDENAATVDPLAPDAPIVFAFSPLVGTPLTTSAKFAVVSRSPLTHRINDALAGSGFAIAGKRCGCDAIMIVGRAKQLSVLVIDDQNVRLQPAEDVDALDSSYRIASIGSAGERGVRYATISHDGRHAGRGGSGAVLGSKNIKAVAVRGTHRCEWAHPRELGELSRDLSAGSFGPATAKYRELGTATNLLTLNRFGALPTRNFQRGTFEQAPALSPAELSAQYSRVGGSCVACTIGCEHIYDIDETGVRVEYESLFALGSLCGVGDSRAVLRASHRCDELGLDTISTGGTIAFAMECVERGLVDEPWLTFGSGDAVLTAIDLIARREGIGDLLAEGSRRAALAIGHDSLAFAPQVKGLEIPRYQPPALQTMALGFAVGTRGADHNRSGAYEVDFSDRVDRLNVGPEAARLAVETEDEAAIMDSLILCKFLRGVFSEKLTEMAEMLALVTGWDVSGPELKRAAQRIVNAKKSYNIREGWTPAEDTLPDRILNQPLPEDARAQLSPTRLTALVEAYNRARGWTPEGWLG